MDEFDLKTYMRNLVSEQVQWVLERRVSVVVDCNWCRKPIGKLRCITFVLIFMNCVASLWRSGGGGEVQSREFRKEWWEYHRREARMELLHGKRYAMKRV
jgi:hypothetical protein